jgi:tripartite-type tricarboxylate transporter receptor subunit TctC
MTKSRSLLSKLPSRRKFLQLTAAAATIPVVSVESWAQSYPTRPITLVAFTPPGALPDVMARLVADGLSRRLGQPVIVENRPGAGGTIALQAVARAPADGHTLLVSSSAHTVAASLYPNVPVTITRDTAPVATIDRDAFMLVVNPSFSAKSLADFVAYAKANPGKVDLASNGTGNLTHLAGELFRTTAGIQTQHVPYRGSPAAIAALMGNDVHALFDTVGAVLPQVQSGKLRALAVTSAQRRPTLPDIPAISETFPGFEVIGWVGISAPLGTPVEIIQRLNKETNATLADPAVKARFADLATDQFVSTQAEFAKFIVEDADKWAKVVKAAGLKVE